MGDKYRLRTPSFGAWKSPRVSDEFSRRDVCEEDIGEFDKVALS